MATDPSRRNHGFVRWMPKRASSDPMWAAIWTIRWHLRFPIFLIGTRVSCTYSLDSIALSETIAAFRRLAMRFCWLSHTSVISYRFVLVPCCLAWSVCASRIRPSHSRHSINRSQYCRKYRRIGALALGTTEWRQSLCTRACPASQWSHATNRSRRFSIGLRQSREYFRFWCRDAKSVIEWKSNWMKLLLPWSDARITFLWWMNVSPSNSWNSNALMSGSVNLMLLLEIMRFSSNGHISNTRLNWYCCSETFDLR